MSATSNCPSCGGAIEFQRDGSLVVVCNYCRSVVARGDRDVESLGKVAALVETDSPLRRGLAGRFERASFQIAGRIQIRHAAGGVWDEWMVSFDDGRWGWLAEAQGKFYLTFEDAAGALPPVTKMKAGATGKIPGFTPRMTVREVGEAEYLGAEGELPFRLTPGQRFKYADLAGPAGEFATIDYSDDPPTLYAGREVPLEALGIAATDLIPRKKGRVGTQSLSCPHCGGPLELRAPDKTQRVTCPNCNSQLDVNGGKLEYLRSLDHTARPRIPLGSRLSFDNVQWQIIGFMIRSTVIDGTRYPWEEYLLYNVAKGFRWLVCSDGHWNFVEPVEGVEMSGASPRQGGRAFRPFQSGVGHVDYVLGEFYWKVEVGEVVRMDDYIAPPLMLSCELATTESSSEMSWSLGRYVTPAALAAALGSDVPDERQGVGANQPFPYEEIYKLWAFAVIATVLLGALFMIMAPREVVAEFRIDPPASGGANPSSTSFSPAFNLTSRRNVQVEMRSNVDNSWAYVAGDLYEAKSGSAYPFGAPIEYYHGYDDGEWKEGKTNTKTYLSSIPPGQYSIRAEAQWPSLAEARSIFVTVRSGVPRVLHLLLALLGVSLIPFAVIAYHVVFESKRWENSSFGGEHASSGDDE